MYKIRNQWWRMVEKKSLRWKNFDGNKIHRTKNKKVYKMHWQAMKKNKNKENLIYSYRFTRKSWYFKFSRLSHDTTRHPAKYRYQLTKNEKNCVENHHIYIISSIKFMQTLTYFTQQHRVVIHVEKEKSACFVYIRIQQCSLFSLNHRYAISIKRWTRWSGCLYTLLPFYFVFSIYRLLCITLVGKWNLCAWVFSTLDKERKAKSERCFSFILFRRIWMFSLYTKDPKICMYFILLILLCFALSRCLAYLPPKYSSFTLIPIPKCICLF